MVKERESEQGVAAASSFPHQVNAPKALYSVSSLKGEGNPLDIWGIYLKTS
jgi:hypothetical protein